MLNVDVELLQLRSSFDFLCFSSKFEKKTMFSFVILAATIFTTNAMEIMSVYHMNPESAGAIPVNMDTGDVRFRFQKNIFFVRNLESHTYVFVSHKNMFFSFGLRTLSNLKSHTYAGAGRLVFLSWQFSTSGGMC